MQKASQYYDEMQGGYMPSGELLPQPGGLPPMMTNPLVAGMQFGLLGSASGLGYAAVQRAIRLQAGNQAPVSVIKPLMIGAVIGTALGAGGSLLAGQKLPNEKPQSWYDLADTIHNNMYGGTMYKNSKYSGLMLIEKRALPVAAAIPAALWKAFLLSTSIAGGIGAAKSGKKAIGEFASGQAKAGLKSLGSAGFNALIAATGIGPAGSAILKVPALARAAQTGKMLKPLQRANFGPGMITSMINKAKGIVPAAVPPLRAPSAFNQVTTAISNRMLQSPAIAAQLKNMSPETLRRFTAAGRNLTSIERRGNKIMWPIMGGQLIGLAAGARKTAPGAVPVSQAVPNINVGSLLSRIPSTPMPQIGIPGITS